MGGAGLPRIDPGKRGLALVRALCESDFPTTGARLGRRRRDPPPRLTALPDGRGRSSPWRAGDVGSGA